MNSSKFITLVNPLDEPVVLEHVIDNKERTYLVGLREITYTSGWFNVSKQIGNTVILTRKSEDDDTATKIKVDNGYYNLETLERKLNTLLGSFKANYHQETGLVQITINKHVNLGKLSKIFGFRNDWMAPGSYFGFSLPEFYNNKTLFLHLEQLNTSSSILARSKKTAAYSTLLRTIPTVDDEYGFTTTYTFDKPQYRELVNNTITELTLSILDASGNKVIMDNSCVITLELKKIK